MLFYKSEKDYESQENPHADIDMSLVYAVQPAPGTDNGINIFTKNGPLRLVSNSMTVQLHVWYILLKLNLIHWQRSRGSDRKYRVWLRSLQAATELKQTPDIGTESKECLLPVIQVQSTSSLDDTDNEADNIDTENNAHVNFGNRFERLSLELIPGMNYSTLDGSHRLHHKSADDFKDLGINPEASSASVKTRGNTKLQIRRKLRPMSESVSSFLHLNSVASKRDINHTVDDTDVIRRSKRGHLARLPTSYAVGKFLSHFERNKGPKSTDDSDKSETQENHIKDPLGEKQLESPTKEETSDKEEDTTKVNASATVDQVKDVEGTEEDKVLERVYLPRRRKSSFAMLKKLQGLLARPVPLLEA